MTDETILKIFDVVEISLAQAGFRLLDSDHDTLIIRDVDADRDFEIKVEEIAN